MKKTLHVFYSGRVQGVGFRFAAQRIAGELRVTGWVKNLEDGRVELCAEAAEETLKEFLSQIESIFSRYIRGTDINWKPATGEFKDFGVRF